MKNVRKPSKEFLKKQYKMKKMNHKGKINKQNDKKIGFIKFSS